MTKKPNQTKINILIDSEKPVSNNVNEQGGNLSGAMGNMMRRRRGHAVKRAMIANPNLSNAEARNISLGLKQNRIIFKDLVKALAEIFLNFSYFRNCL